MNTQTIASIAIALVSFGLGIWYFYSTQVAAQTPRTWCKTYHNENCIFWVVENMYYMNQDQIFAISDECNKVCEDLNQNCQVCPARGLDVMHYYCTEDIQVNCVAHWNKTEADIKIEKKLAREERERSNV